MKSFVLSALVFASASAIRTNPVSTIPQAAIDRAYTQKQLTQNTTNTTNDTKVAIIQNTTNTTKVAAIQAKVTTNTTAKATAGDFKNPLLGNSEPKPKEDKDAEKEPVAWNPDTLPACPSAERTMMDDGKTHVVKYPYVGATCKAASLAEVESADEDAKAPKKGAAKPAAKGAAKPAAKGAAKPAAKGAAKPAAKGAAKPAAKGAAKPGAKGKPAVKKDPAPWRHLEHCPDFNERRTLKNGKTEAVPYPKKGYNCSNEGPV